MYLNNVFGINKIGEIQWRIQNVSDVFHVKNQLPFKISWLKVLMFMCLTFTAESSRLTQLVERYFQVML
jgi:hypothetical protein